MAIFPSADTSPFGEYGRRAHVCTTFASMLMFQLEMFIDTGLLPPHILGYGRVPSLRKLRSTMKDESMSKKMASVIKLYDDNFRARETKKSKAKKDVGIRDDAISETQHSDVAEDDVSWTHNATHVAVQTDKTRLLIRRDEVHTDVDRYLPPAAGSYILIGEMAYYRDYRLRVRKVEGENVKGILLAANLNGNENDASSGAFSSDTGNFNARTESTSSNPRIDAFLTDDILYSTATNIDYFTDILNWDPLSKSFLKTETLTKAEKDYYKIGAHYMQHVFHNKWYGGLPAKPRMTMSSDYSSNTSVSDDSWDDFLTATTYGVLHSVRSLSTVGLAESVSHEVHGESTEDMSIDLFNDLRIERWKNQVEIAEREDREMDIKRAKLDLNQQLLLPDLPKLPKRFPRRIRLPLTGDDNPHQFRKLSRGEAHILRSYLIFLEMLQDPDLYPSGENHALAAGSARLLPDDWRLYSECMRLYERTGRTPAMGWDFGKDGLEKTDLEMQLKAKKVGMSDEAVEEKTGSDGNYESLFPGEEAVLREGIDDIQIAIQSGAIRWRDGTLTGIYSIEDDERNVRDSDKGIHNYVHNYSVDRGGSNAVSLSPAGNEENGSFTHSKVKVEGFTHGKSPNKKDRDGLSYDKKSNRERFSAIVISRSVVGDFVKIDPLGHFSNTTMSVVKVEDLDATVYFSSHAPESLVKSLLAVEHRGDTSTQTVGRLLPAIIVSYKRGDIMIGPAPNLQRKEIHSSDMEPSDRKSMIHFAIGGNLSLGISNGNDFVSDAIATHGSNFLKKNGSTSTQGKLMFPIKELVTCPSLFTSFDDINLSRQYLLYTINKWESEFIVRHGISVMFDDYYSDGYFHYDLHHYFVLKDLPRGLPPGKHDAGRSFSSDHNAWRLSSGNSSVDDKDSTGQDSATAASQEEARRRSAGSATEVSQVKIDVNGLMLADPNANGLGLDDIQKQMEAVGVQTLDEWFAMQESLKDQGIGITPMQARSIKTLQKYKAVREDFDFRVKAKKIVAKKAKGSYSKRVEKSVDDSYSDIKLDTYSLLNLVHYALSMRFVELEKRLLFEGPTLDMFYSFIWLSKIFALWYDYLQKLYMRLPSGRKLRKAVKRLSDDIRWMESQQRAVHIGKKIFDIDDTESEMSIHSAESKRFWIVKSEQGNKGLKQVFLHQDDEDEGQGVIDDKMLRLNKTFDGRSKNSSSAKENSGVTENTGGAGDDETAFGSRKLPDWYAAKLKRRLELLDEWRIEKRVVEEQRRDLHFEAAFYLPQFAPLSNAVIVGSLCEDGFQLMAFNEAPYVHELLQLLGTYQVVIPERQTGRKVWHAKNVYTIDNSVNGFTRYYNAPSRGSTHLGCFKEQHVPSNEKVVEVLLEDESIQGRAINADTTNSTQGGGSKSQPDYKYCHNKAEWYFAGEIFESEFDDDSESSGSGGPKPSSKSVDVAKSQLLNWANSLVLNDKKFGLDLDDLYQILPYPFRDCHKPTVLYNGDPVLALITCFENFVEKTPVYPIISPFIDPQISCRPLEYKVQYAFLQVLKYTEFHEIVEIGGGSLAFFTQTMRFFATDFLVFAFFLLIENNVQCNSQNSFYGGTKYDDGQDSDNVEGDDSSDVISSGSHNIFDCLAKDFSIFDYKSRLRYVQRSLNKDLQKPEEEREFSLIERAALVSQLENIKKAQLDSLRGYIRMQLRDAAATFAYKWRYEIYQNRELIEYGRQSSIGGSVSSANTISERPPHQPVAPTVLKDTHLMVTRHCAATPGCEKSVINSGAFETVNRLRSRVNSNLLSSFPWKYTVVDLDFVTQQQLWAVENKQREMLQNVAKTAHSILFEKARLDGDDEVQNLFFEMVDVELANMNFFRLVNKPKEKEIKNSKNIKVSEGTNAKDIQSRGISAGKNANRSVVDLLTDRDSIYENDHELVVHSATSTVTLSESLRDILDEFEVYDDETENPEQLEWSESEPKLFWPGIQVEIVPFSQKEKLIQNRRLPEKTLLVATNSLSELTMENFNWYYENLIQPRADYMIYYHSPTQKWPGPLKKKEKLLDVMDVKPMDFDNTSEHGRATFEAAARHGGGNDVLKNDGRWDGHVNLFSQAKDEEQLLLLVKKEFIDQYSN